MRGGNQVNCTEREQEIKNALRSEDGGSHPPLPSKTRPPGAAMLAGWPPGDAAGPCVGTRRQRVLVDSGGGSCCSPVPGSCGVPRDGCCHGGCRMNPDVGEAPGKSHRDGGDDIVYGCGSRSGRCVPPQLSPCCFVPSAQVRAQPRLCLVLSWCFACPRQNQQPLLFPVLDTSDFRLFQAERGDFLNYSLF